MTAIVELDTVSKTYSGGIDVLRDVSLLVEDGDFVAVVGPSGSGKSTMLHLIGTLDRPTSGRVRIAGHDVSRLSDREVSALRAKYIGFVFQQFHLVALSPIRKSVADGLLYAGESRLDR